jgi:1,4-dihydroxy-6-naphthoate synthase
MPLYTLGISPCPNDTFIFDALIHRRFPSACSVRTHMADVEELNSLARKGVLEITKLSLAAALEVLDHYVLLRSGAALGRGCGPLLVARPGLSPERYAAARIAIPGRMTTANLLLSLNGEFAGQRLEMVFDAVMPAVKNGDADLGVIIHEGRFTYARQGLTLVRDLGEWWESVTRLPLPLGVIAVRRNLGMETALAIEESIRQSLLFARAHPLAGQNFIRSHAQEMDPAVMAAHIDTFVNDFSLSLGPEGQKAVMALLEAGAGERGTTLPEQPVFVEECNR